MGYTHHAYQNKPLTDEQMSEAFGLLDRFCRYTKDMSCAVRISIADEKKIVIEGVYGACEPIILRQSPLKYGFDPELLSPRGFMFTKTNRMAYDPAVVAVYALLNTMYPSLFEAGSDGGYGNLLDGMALASQFFEEPVRFGEYWFDATEHFEE